MTNTNTAAASAAPDLRTAAQAVLDADDANILSQANIDSLRAALAAPVQPAYGATEFGWTDYRQLEDGDKRLISLIIGLYGNDHQSSSDLEGLLDRAARGAAKAANVAGLESAVAHLSCLLDAFRALLVEVDDVCGRDGFDRVLEDGESEIIDKIRAALAMTNAAPAQAVAHAQEGKYPELPKPAHPMGPMPYVLQAPAYAADQMRDYADATCAARGAAQAAPVDADVQRDAERYRWLREQPNDTNAPRIDVVQWAAADESANEGQGMRMKTLDEAIDAARAAEGGA